MTENMSIDTDPNFPSNDWTVEQVMHWCLQNATQNLESYQKETEQMLLNELEYEIQGIWDTYNRCINGVTDNYNTKSAVNNNPHENSENVQPNIQPSKVVGLKAQQQQQPSTSVLPVDDATIRVDVTTGPYIGKVFFLKPTPRVACLIGRSTSKKFKDKGISLPKDGEVSTSHGKIEKIDGKYYYTDTGSTNGSRLQESSFEIPPHEALEIPAGGVFAIVIGASVLHITVLDPKCNN